MKNFSLTPQGTLVVVESTGIDGDGMPTSRQWEVDAEQIAKLRRDPDFDAAIPADIRATLDALKAE